MKVIFENKGVIDLRAIKMFGISAKTGENPIGFFGTGLKYAIAIILRERCELTLFAGLDRYDFKVETISMREKSFEVITMNGEELPFTTELGKNWELWQAFRELYCNTKDENGTIYACNDHTDGIEGMTRFIVNGECFKSVFDKRSDYFLDLSDHLKIKEGTIEIFNKPSDGIFYRGIRVGDLPKQSLFTYNFASTKIDLTEDRTVKYMHSVIDQMTKASIQIEEKFHCKRLLTAKKDFLENDFDFNFWSGIEVHHPSDAFIKTLEKCFDDNTDFLNHSARRLETARRKSKTSKNLQPLVLNEVEKKQLVRAREICGRVFPRSDKYEVLVVEHLGEETMAFADMEQERIVLSKRSFTMGTKFLISTMIEEYMHLDTGFGDHTRELQTHLFDTICTLIETNVIMEAM